jgi:hypothetical protein
LNTILSDNQKEGGADVDVQDENVEPSENTQ